LLTHDLDFGELIAASGVRLPSVIVFRLRNMRPEGVNSHLASVIDQHAEALVHGAIVSVTEGLARVRLLPIDTDR
jgi:predicted nuclease of predicted toxin-antitoxin system